MIKDVGDKFDDYSISPKIRQIFLHRGYHELTEKDFFRLFQQKRNLAESKRKKSKEEAGEYYLQNKEAIKEKSKIRYQNLSKEEKDKIKEYQRKRFQQLIQYKKEVLQNKRVLFLLSIRMSETTLKFDNIRVNKK